jgi:hypothetical protein
MVSDTARMGLMIAAAAVAFWFVRQRVPLASYLVDLALPIAGGAAAAFMILLAVDISNGRQT